MLFASLPKPQSGVNFMSSKVKLDTKVTPSSTDAASVGPSKPSTVLMPNSVKKRLEKQSKEEKTAVTPAPVAPLPAQVASDSDDSDHEGGFFNFNTKEEDAEELKRHAMSDVGPTRPTRDMLRKERDKFIKDEAGPSDEPVKYTTTRHPEEAEESAIAPYGHDLAGYTAIAGPIRRQSVKSDDYDAGLDIEGEAIRKLQGRRHEEVQFVDAKVDKSLGNIRENIRKGAHQKHISTSIVDPLKDMKKTDPNAHVSKRTHQLKYLVELAKANETRLNQLWSNAKSSSRTTAQKYGW